GETPPERSRTGIGLQSVLRRIALVYGEPYGVALQSEPGQGTTVIMKLPLTNEPVEEDEEGPPA
ncbi:putative two-component sensor histidine kinase, partial [Paenibacillus sp. 598K]|uniref:sensor histidine kinase n=1 Tax=Paenibacillus sp. 598K TaxID=1117987 RepID=UPI000FF999B6